MGIAPPLAGVVYGMSFAAPLVVMTLLVSTRFHHPSRGIRPWSAVPVQLGGIASMLVLAFVSILVIGGG
jgi:hypothetical protein